MPVTVHVDSNGIKYNAIGTSEWAGAEGSQLRSQGWSYCGFGTWGIYITPPGVQCFPKVSGGGGANILPPAPQQPDTGTSVPLVTDHACGSCRRRTTTSPVGAPDVGVPTQPGTKVIVKKSGLPWWVILLALLLAAKVVGDE